MAHADTLTLEPPLATLPPAPAAEPSTGSRAVWAAAALIVAAGGAIRFAALSTSIWFDESVSVRDVSGSFGQMLHRVANHEASPPFYFICLWVWRHLVGTTAVDLRALSALTGTVTIALAFSVARRRLGSRAALILAALIAVSPALIYYSTEMRMYGLLVLLTGVGFDAFLSASSSPSRRNLAIWAGASLLAVWTQYYAALAVAPQALLLLVGAWRNRPWSRGTLLAVGGLAVGAAPLLYLMPYQSAHAFNYGTGLLSSAWRRSPLSIHVGSSVSDIVQGLVAGPGGPARPLLAAVTMLIGIIAVALLVRRPRIPRSQLLLGVWLLAPAFLVVETLTHLHILLEGRYLLPLWLPVGLAAGYALSSIGPVGLGLTAVLLCLWIAAGVVTVAVPRFAVRDDTLGAARSLGVAATDRLIAINQPWDVLALQEYRPRTTLDSSRVVRVRELDVIAMPIGGEPPPAEHSRPSSLGAGTLPRGLALAQIIRGPTFLLERFVARRPVSLRVDGYGGAFSSPQWRFLTEPAGARLGSL